MRKLPFDRHLSLQNVRKVVSEADGYQPHLIAPEQGYRRLIESSLNYFRGPAEASVDAVSNSSFCNYFVKYIEDHNMVFSSIDIYVERSGVFFFFFKLFLIMDTRCHYKHMEKFVRQRTCGRKNLFTEFVRHMSL